MNDYQTITWRLQLHDETPNDVKENMCQGLINEGHLHEIFVLCVNTYLSPWLTTEEAV